RMCLHHCIHGGHPDAENSSASLAHAGEDLMPDQNNETLHHLLDDFGMYKSTVRRNFDDNDRGPEYDHVRELLDRRTQRYTLAELKEISGFFCTAHDECVIENPDDYTPLQVYAAKNKVLA